MQSPDMEVRATMSREDAELLLGLIEDEMQDIDEMINCGLGHMVQESDRVRKLRTRLEAAILDTEILF